MPQIAKTFQTRVSRREDYRIACYDAAQDGWLGPHRDNPTKQTRHRRFTLAVTLNAEEFEGGALRFREYSARGYRVPTGSAIVWSCALLHEVTPVTAGRRFILGTHLFGGRARRAFRCDPWPARPALVTHAAQTFTVVSRCSRLNMNELAGVSDTPEKKQRSGRTIPQRHQEGAINAKDKR